MVTEEQVKAAALKAGFPDLYREALEIGLIQNLSMINEGLNKSSPRIMVWLASGMYTAVVIDYSQELMFAALKTFVTELFQDVDMRTIALRAVANIKKLFETADLL